MSRMSELHADLAAHDDRVRDAALEMLDALKTCREFFEDHIGDLFGPGHSIPMAAGASLAIRAIEKALSKAGEL